MVPTSADVDHYRRELAAAGIVFGAEVLTFRRLVREIAARGRDPRPPARAGGARARGARGGPRHASAGAGGVSARARLHARGAASCSPSSGARSSRPARFTRALRALGGGRRARPRTRRSSPRSTRPTTGGWRRSARRDEQGHARAALDALRERPAAWGARPVLLYGFDDLTPLQLDAVETLARPRRGRGLGRAALRGRARGVRRATRRPSSCSSRSPTRHVALEDRSEHYAAGRARRAAPPRAAAVRGRRRRRVAQRRRAAARGGRRARRGRARRRGGARADARGRRARGHRRAGARAASAAVAVLADGLADYGVPVAPDARVPLARTRLGAGVLAFARAALPGGTAADVLTWLRTPGKLADPDAADALEARARRTEAATAADARAPVGGRRCPSSTRSRTPRPQGPVDAARGAARRGGGDLDRAAPPPRRRARPRGGRRRARGRRAARRRRASCARSPRPTRRCWRRRRGRARGAGRRRGPPGRGARRRARRRPRSAIRARRFRAVFVCGLQDGEFPRRPSPEPFLDDDARASLARASGLVLRRHEDVLGEERHLFYACVSRPEEVLFLSFRSSDEEGDPVQPSPFVDDVRALFTDELWRERGHAAARRGHVAARRPRRRRTSCGARRRRPSARRSPPPLGAPGSRRRCSAALAARGPEAARGAGDVRRLRRALARRGAAQARSAPSPTRSRCAGARSRTRVLERTLRGLKRAHGLGAAGAGHARRGARRSSTRALGASCARAAAASCDAPAAGPRCGRSRRTSCATCATRPRPAPGWSPSGSSGASAREGDSHGALALNGSGFSVTGRVDRIDVDGSGRAMVRDYKGKTVYAGARWAQDGRLQAALYALAARELLGLEPAGALYQPIGKRRPPPARARRAPARRAATSTATWSTPEALDAALLTRRARPRSAPRARCARAGSARARRAARRTAAPTRASAAPPRQAGGGAAS